jgi:polysaccharide biosynthesis/export protein PslD
MLSRPVVLLSTLTLFLAAACASPQGEPLHVMAEEINVTLSEASETVVVPGDVLGVRTVSLAAFETRDLDVQVPVQPDGKVVLPGVGAVHVAGRTPAQLTELMRESLSDDLAVGSKVAVTIAVPAMRTVHIIGAVGKPGVLPVPPDRHMTLVEAFAEAGGVGAYASYLGNTMIVRWDEANQRQVSWVVDARARWWGEDQTILLQPNDVVYVPDTPVARVNAWLDRYIIRNIPFPRTILPGL